MSRYPKLPKLNSELWESLPARPPPQTQIADPSVAAKNVLDGSPEVQLRRKQTNDRTTRRKLRPANAFRLSLTSKAMAYFLGICLHFLHICLRMGRMQSTAQSNCNWEDLSGVDADGAWIDWTDFGCLILIVGAALHGVVMLSRFEIYRPVGRKTTLTIWSPNEFELHLLCVYSPAHALMWMVTSSANWMLMVVIMALLSKQLYVLGEAYYALVSDKQIVTSVD